MSEGFAQMSASLYISFIEKNPKKFIEFWNDERTTLLERNTQGFRAIDVGPVTMGYRADNSRTGFDVTRGLIYAKGAYILHMIRMMMWSNKTGDQDFKAAMQDFVKTYSGKAATTEDFKAMMEKHMTQEMDLEGNHRLDWFFNEYVYGTALPTYKIDSTFEKDANGDVVFGFKVTQSGVDDKFRMIVPIYLELADGRTRKAGPCEPHRKQFDGSEGSAEGVERYTQTRALELQRRRASVELSWALFEKWGSGPATPLLPNGWSRRRRRIADQVSNWNLASRKLANLPLVFACSQLFNHVPQFFWPIGPKARHHSIEQ